MLSRLSKGYGSWVAGYVDPYYGDKKAHPHEHEHSFPEIDQESHIHGVTVGSRSGRTTALSWTTTRRSREPTLDGIPLPKTYTTRQGALQLYVGPDDLEDEELDTQEEDSYALKPRYIELKRPHGQELIDLSLKLGTIERLALSVLQFGDQEYDHEHTSITDAKNKAFLKFLHDVDQRVKPLDVDSSVQPGGDLNSYLRDLKSSASQRSNSMRMSKSRESMELQAILRGLDNNAGWPMSYSDGASDRQSTGQFTRPVSRVSSRGPSPGPSTTPRSTYQVLSAKKICASIKSGSYLGRPSSIVSAYDEDLVEGEIPGPVTSATISRPIWSPKDSTDDVLIDARKRCQQSEDEGETESGKHRGFKERSFLTNNSQLYKGRNAHQGEGHSADEVKVMVTCEDDHANKVKVTAVGEGESPHQGHKLIHFDEKIGDGSHIKNNRKVNLKKFHSEGTLHEIISESKADITRPETVLSDSFIFGEKHLSIDHEKDQKNISLEYTDIEMDEKLSNKSREDHLMRKDSSSKSRPSSGVVRPTSRPCSAAVRPTSRLKNGEVKIRSRPGSERSDGSSGSTSTHTPSIITLQSYNAQEKPSSRQERYLNKRRNTYAYDPVKGLVKVHMTRRKSENYIDSRKQNSSNIDFSHLQYQQSSYGANDYQVGQNIYHGHPSHLSKSSFDWPVHSNTPDWPENAYEDAIDARAEGGYAENSFRQTDTHGPGLKQKKQVHIDELETAVIDQEEYILDNIAECNEEIKQIEALGEERMSEVSDSDSSMDEEMIKIILAGSEPGDVRGQDQMEKEQQAHPVTEDRPEENCLEADGLQDMNKMEAKDESKDQEDDENLPFRSGSGLSEKGGNDLEVIEEGQMARANSVESEHEMEEHGVDEEHASELGSTRSGRKSRSRRSKSRVSSEDIEDGDSERGSLLPALESDRLLQEKDAHSIVAELDALGLRQKPGKRPKAPPEKAKIPDHIAEALNRQTDASREQLEQDLERMTAMVGESLSGPTLEAVGEGLTEEELELAKQILQQKIDEAKGKLEGKQPAAKPRGKKATKGGAKKGGKKKKGQEVVQESSPELDREALREKHEQEKRNEEYLKQREKEAAALQRKIAEKRRLMMEQEDATSARSKELKEEMERLEREAEAIQRAEDEAREMLADVRKKQREEREARRKADLERKKQEALERREREKKEMEEKRRKEAEMLEKIADADMRRRMREEEERRIAEEERLAQEKYEEEMREAQRLQEEEEERLREMERQVEEEAMQRLIEEREAAERERRRIREEEEALQEAERLKMVAMEEEHNRLEAERRKIEEAELAKREAERQRLLELRRLEEEARIKMQQEIEKRRADALARRDYNLENRQHIDKLGYGQGITKAWTFSYFVHWPRETYESKLRPKLGFRRSRPIGAPDPRKVVKINNPRPKKVIDTPAEAQEAPPAAPT